MNTLLQIAHTLGEYTDYTTTTTTTNVDATAAAGIAAFTFLGVLLFAAVAYVITALLLGRIFKKAGVKQWIAWVPFYSGWKMNELGGQQGFWAVLTIIPIVQYVSIVFMYIAMYNIGLKLGKSGGFVALGIFLPIVWMIWLAVDDSKWNDKLGVPSKAVEHTGPTPAA